MKTLRLLSLVAGFAFLFSGCSGPEGPQGPAGTNGLDGANGVANINIVVADITSWTLNASPTYYYATLTDGAITDPTAETVQVFFSATSNNGPWQALPANNVFNSGDQITYSWTTNTVTFFYDYTSLTNVPLDVYFNVAVIPPAVMKKHPGFNWKDGNAVLHLPEMEAAMHSSISKN
ncbi:MAG TPA: hypothetical protein VNZ45_09025 [Bacteroidia bacterium]|jgi:hypothetical protein|nr:hypothetical protein [Bacteroidia bacterium]